MGLSPFSLIVACTRRAGKALDLPMAVGADAHYGLAQFEPALDGL
jgi:hypothetical protein